MKRKHHKIDEVVRKLHEAGVLGGAGTGHLAASSSASCRSINTHSIGLKLRSETCPVRRSKLRRNSDADRCCSMACFDRKPCLSEFLADLALPSAVLGPVLDSHGFTRFADARKDASPWGVSR